MASKSSTRKASKSAAPARATSTVTPAIRKKPATRAATNLTQAAKAPVKAKSATAKAADTKQTITFTYFAPQAGSVFVAGDFTQWAASPIGLVKEAGGTWKTTVALKPGKYEYRLLVDGQWQNDPACPEVQPNEFGSANCILSVAA